MGYLLLLLCFLLAVILSSRGERLIPADHVTCEDSAHQHGEDADNKVGEFAQKRRTQSEDTDSTKQKKSRATASAKRSDESRETRSTTQRPTPRSKKERTAEISEFWMEGIRIRKINKSPLDILLEEDVSA